MAVAAGAIPTGSAARAQTGPMAGPADASPWAANERGAVRLVSAVQAVGAGRTVDIGIELRLQHGWKTYWRAPGESGMPPRFDWSASGNLAAVAITWPGPKRFAIAGIQSYGYGNRVILPVRLTLAEPGGPVSIRLHLRYANCREICVPEEARLALDLPAGPAAATAHAPAIAAYAARAPKPGEALGWRIERATIVAYGQGATRHAKLVVEAASRETGFEAPDLVAEAGDRLNFGMSSAKLDESRLRARFYVPIRGVDAAAAQAFAGALVLTLLDGRRRGTFTISIAGQQR